MSMRFTRTEILVMVVITFIMVAVVYGSGITKVPNPANATISQNSSSTSN